MNANRHEWIGSPGLLGVSCLLLAACCALGSELATDDEVVFFPAIGHPIDKGAAWEVDVQGWVFEPERRKTELDLFRKALGVRNDETSREENEIFGERARTFMVDNERRKDISIRLGDKTYPLGRSGAGGRVVGRIRLGSDEVQRLRQQRGGSDRITFYAVLPADDRRIFAGVIELLADTGLSVISDIDDTIKVTEVNDKRALLMNTFFRPFRPVDGMATVYQSWAKPGGTSFHYVSESPWPLYPSLADFALANGFPAGTFHLKPFRWRDEFFFDLFKSPEDYKLGVIEPLLKRFPHRQFVLVGDSGQKDPETYGMLARKFPKQIVRICIRDVTGEPADSERFRKAFKDVPSAIWTVFHYPGEIENAVR